MYISEILDVTFENSTTFYVKAVAEDCVLEYNQTWYDPPEYGPSTVIGYISINDIEEYLSEKGLQISTENLVDIIKEYLETIDYDLNWSILNQDY
jgi:hypothetical protein